MNIYHSRLESPSIDELKAFFLGIVVVTLDKIISSDRIRVYTGSRKSSEQIETIFCSAFYKHKKKMTDKSIDIDLHRALTLYGVNKADEVRETMGTIPDSLFELFQKTQLINNSIEKRNDRQRTT